MLKSSVENLVGITGQILRERYPRAEFAFLAGSFVRGEATAFSDLDIVVIYRELEAAFRESFYFRDFPVEAFVHTPETLNYFFAQDAEHGIPSLPQMVAEGIAVPEKTELSEELKLLAAKVLANSPKLSAAQVDRLRYALTNLIDDLRDPRSEDEMRATAAELYKELADFYFRANGLWSAGGKSVPRKPEQAASELCRQFNKSFEELFVRGNRQKVIELTESILKPHGGFLFEDFKLTAPENWRKPVPKNFK